MNLPKFTQKTLTKLQNSQFRERILNSVDKNSKFFIELKNYARAAINYQLMSRNKKLETDKNSYYGFSPLGIICAVDYNGNVEKKLIEFTHINNALRIYQTSTAIDILMCMCLLWKAEQPKLVANFSEDIIESELKKLDS